MSFSNNKLYYSAIILQLSILIFTCLFRNCVTCGHDNYINTIRDYRLCANKMDSLILDNRNKALQLKSCKDSVKQIGIEEKPYTVNNKTINFIDSIKVSYPGKDGMEVIKTYPFHKVIVD